MKFSVVAASLLAFAWASSDVLSVAFAEEGTALADSKYVECVVKVSGGELEDFAVLDRQKIELKLQADSSWLGRGELQIDPETKHGFILRKTTSPGIDLVTGLSNGIELGFSVSNKSKSISSVRGMRFIFTARTRRLRRQALRFHISDADYRMLSGVSLPEPEPEPRPLVTSSILFPLSVDWNR